MSGALARLKDVYKDEQVRDQVFISERRSGDSVISVRNVVKRYGDYVQGIPTMNSLRYCLGRSGFEIGGKIMGATHFTFTSKKNKILKAIGGVLSKIYDKLHVETADHLIILAKKRFEVKNV